MVQEIPQLLEPEQAAQALGVSPRTLANWRCLGIGPAYVCVGRARRYRAADLSSWADAHRMDPSAPRDRRQRG